MKFKKKRLLFIIAIPAVVLLTAGGIFALNGWFGGGGAIPSDTMTRGLVGYWNFEDGRGTTTADISGNDNTGIFQTTAASPEWVQGKVGNALNFDGADDYVSGGNDASLQITGAITIEAWVKRLTTTDRDIVFAKHQNKSGSYGYQFDINPNADNVIRFGMSSNGSNFLSVSTVAAFTDSGWHHLAATYDGASIGKIYLDGVSQSLGASTLSGNIYNTISPAIIGARESATDGVFEHFFPGLVDEVRVYNRALSAEEIRYHYNRGAPVGYWKFDEGASTTAYDSSGNGNTGTLTNMNVTTATSSWTTGKYGTALNFDGVNDYVSTPITTLSSWSSITYEVWINWSGGTACQRVIDKGGGRASLNLGCYGAFAWEISNSSGVGKKIYFSGTPPFSSRVWTHIAATYDGSSMRLYANGTLIGSADQSGTIQDIGDNLLIGATSGGGAGFFNGLIDDVRIYNYARTEDEIRLDYNAGFSALFGPQGSSCDIDPGSCMTKGLVGYWGMDEGVGTTTADISGNNNTAVALTAAATPQWTKGKAGGALSFDGTDDSVSIPHNNSLAIANDVSVEAWINVDSDASSNGTIINKYKYVIVTNAGGYTLIWNATNKSVYLYLRNNAIYDGSGATQAESAANSVTAGSGWHHVAGVRSGNDLYVYIDGVFSGTKGSFSTTIRDMGDVAAIGANWSGTGNFRGKIDEARIYNRALSAEEVRYHYNRGGPIGWWKFDEGASTTAYDSSGNGNTGTLTNMNVTTATSSWTTGKYGTALNFDGVNDYVSAADSSSLDIVDAITISAWINPRTTGENGYGRIVSKGTSDGYELYLRLSDPANALTFRSDTNGITQNSNANSITLNVWQHIVVTYDKQRVKFYVNGIYQGGGVETGSISANARDLYIGEGVETTNRTFDGLIDDVKLYNYARTQEQIMQDYNAGLAASFGPKSSCDTDPGSCVTKGLVGYWGMDEGVGTTTADISGNNNTAVALTAAATPQWTKGKAGGALSFDGTDDYVNAGNASSLNVQAGFTIMGWINIRGLHATEYFRYISKADEYEVYGSIGEEATTSALRLRIWNTDLTAFNSQTLPDEPLEFNTWYHVAWTFDGNTIKSFSNGKKAATEIAFTGTIYAGTTNLLLGAQNSGQRFLNGLIDDVRIYSRALSAEEVRYHYNKGGPVAYWKFNEGSGTTTYDGSGNNNTGQMQTAASSPAWTAGKYGSALNFDGTDDYVKVADSASLDIADAITIAMWVKSTVNSGSLTKLDRMLEKTESYTFDFNHDLWGKANFGFKWGTTGLEWANLQYSTTLPANTWMYLVGTYDGQNMKVYLNGVQDNSAAESRAIVLNNNSAYIGTYNGTTGTYNFSGLIDDVRIYNYARTQDQILQDYNQGMGTFFK